MRVGLATIQAGRHAHLENQAAAVRRLAGLDRYLVVSMDDTPAPGDAEVLRIGAADPERLPLAAARNAAVAELADCDLVILLDVDCLPEPGLLDAYRSAAQATDPGQAILLGPVGWLSEPVAANGPDPADVARARRSAKREFPPAGAAPRPERRPEFLWSLNMAVAPELHRRVGGFDEDYCGWGGEDTDFGRRAVAAGTRLWKVADAWAFHQPHLPARQTPGQIAALVDNARRFHARWGDWPMPDVLGELARAGQIEWTPQGIGIAVGPALAGANRA